MKENIHALKFERFKEIVHPLLIKLMTSKTTGELDVEGEFPQEGNYLIVANHACIEDIPTLGQAIKKHFYLLVSDEDQKTIDGLGLELNGVEWVHRTDNESRKKVYSNIVELLKRGKNFAMYPESTWNLSPNQLMMPMNYGCIRIALDAGKQIVPVVTYFSNLKRYTKIGKPYTPKADLVESIAELRDIMATMMYTLMEKYQKEAFYIDSNVNCYATYDLEYYCEIRKNFISGMWDKNIYERYNAYARAKNDMAGVREFESQFIFTPKNESNQFFQEFNSVVYTDNYGNTIVKRISSEKNGYDGLTFGEEATKSSFGFGYNEKVLKKTLNK